MMTIILKKCKMEMYYDQRHVLKLIYIKSILVDYKNPYSEKMFPQVNFYKKKKVMSNLHSNNKFITKNCFTCSIKHFILILPCF